MHEKHLSAASNAFHSRQSVISLTHASPSSIALRTTTIPNRCYYRNVFKYKSYEHHNGLITPDRRIQGQEMLRVHIAKQVLRVTKLPLRTKFRSPYAPLCHQFKGQSNSSVRVDIAKHVLLNECHLTAAGIVSRRTATYRWKKNNKLQHFQHFVIPDVSSYDPTAVTFFLTTTYDKYFETYKPILQLRESVTFLPVTSLQIIDNNNGCCHDFSGSLTFVKFPRKWALQKAKHVSDDAATLHRLLHGNKLQRGDSHLDVSQNYRTFGMFCARNATSILQKEELRTSNISLHDKHQLRFMYIRANQLALRVLPTEFIRGLRSAHNLIQWDTIGNQHSKSTINLWAAAAASYNYVSGSHIDDDFFYSALTVICHDDNDVTETICGECHYKACLPTAVYFCLPKKGVAIALRPGDFILFNPTEPHCVSMREKFYENKCVFLMSFYLKSAIVGRNDNSMPNDQFLSSQFLDFVVDAA